MALLIDDKYALFPFDLASKGCAYAVLGWYYIAHAWGNFSSIISIVVTKLVPKLSTNLRQIVGEGWYDISLHSSGPTDKANPGGIM